MDKFCGIQCTQIDYALHCSAVRSLKSCQLNSFRLYLGASCVRVLGDSVCASELFDITLVYDNELIYLILGTSGTPQIVTELWEKALNRLSTEFKFSYSQRNNCARLRAVNKPWVIKQRISDSPQSQIDTM
jgi:hypothetical protein